MDRVYEPLIKVRDDGSWGPRLAKSWEFDPDTTAWTFHLDERATWHDGNPVTADDVKFTYEKSYEYDFAPGGDSKPFVVSIDVVDEHTVRFILTEPIADWPNLASSVSIAPKHIWENIADIATYQNPEPVGSGPFTWVEYDPLSHLLLAANKNYYLGAPAYDELLLKLYANEEAALLALRAGEVDMTAVGVYTAIPTLLEIPEIAINIDRTANRYSLLYLNHRFPPNDIKEFRHAVNLAIDRQAIIDFALYGYGTWPRMCPFIPEVEANLAIEAPAQDIAAANAILDGLGYAKGADGIRVADGVRLEFELAIGTDPPSVRTGEIVRDNMEDIGIKLTLKAVEFGTMMGLIFSGEHFYDWGWAVLVHGAWVGFVGMAVEYAPVPYNPWFDAPSIGWGDDGAGGGTAEALALQALIRQAMREPDPDVRYGLIQQVQAEFADQLPIIVTYRETMVSAYRTDRFEGWYMVLERALLSTPNLISLRPK